QPVVRFGAGSDGSALDDFTSLDDFTVRNGDAEYGGGDFIEGTQVTVLNSVVTSNSAFREGGGIHVGRHSTATVTGNQILYNTVPTGGGGGMSVIDDSSVNVHANTIAYNRVGGFGGGGMSIFNGSVVTITNNIVVSNVNTEMWSEGDGIAVYGEAVLGDTTQAQLVNNTIAFNSGDGVKADNSTVLVLVRNNIIVGNGRGIHDVDDKGAAITIDHNDVWDNGEDYLHVTPGAGDISADPLFVDVANGDYHLQVGSPCIDKGTSTGAPTHDIAGTPRDAAPDMGAYEWTGFRIFLPLTLRSFGP
ncbi:MAG: right-handed parallel beta-helix repeat-containing protein, partial [Chloroflexi bacterium]|nr:right-handed parallel beta-helix repeat-containing protein [Chloroflexota bacterium]